MKTFLKVLKVSLIVLVVIFVLLLGAGWIFQGKITEMALESVSETIGAPMGTGKVKFSLISEFPHAAIQFEDLWIASASRDSLKPATLDTLVKIGKLRFAVKTGPLMDNVFKVKEIKVEDGFAKYFVDESGATNFDFLLVTDSTEVVVEDTTSSPMPTVSLDLLSLKNITCYYRDDQQGAGAKVFIPEVKISAQLDSITTQATVAGEVGLKAVHFEGTNLYRLKDGKLIFDLAYGADTLIINGFTANVDDAQISSSGKVAAGENIHMNLALSASVPDLAAMTKYVPEEVFREYQLQQLAGGISLDAKLSGIYSESQMPHYEANFDLSNASIRAMDYPLVYNVSLKGSATNGQRNNDATTSVNLDNFSFEASGNSVSISGSFRNLEKLRYDIRSQLSVDLGKSKDLIPDSLIQNPTGKILVRLETKGILPDSIDDAFINRALKQSKLDLNFDKVGMSMDTISVRRLSGKINYGNNRLSVNGFKASVPEYEANVNIDGLKVSSSSSLLSEKDIRIVLQKYRFSIPGNSISGNLSISNLKSPTFDMGTKINLNLAKLMKHAPDTLVKNMKGKLSVSINSKGKLDLDKIEEQIEDIIYDQTKIDINMNGITLDMTDEMMNIDDLTGQINIGDHQIKVKDFSGSYSGIDFRIPRTTITNPFNTAVRNEKGFLKVDGEYHLGDIDYTALGALMAGVESEAPSAEEKPSEPVNWNMDVRGSVRIASFRYDSAILIEGITSRYQFSDTVFEAKGKFGAERIQYGKAEITEVYGLFNSKKTRHIIDKLKFKAFGGSGIASAKVIPQDDGGMEVQMKTQAEGLDIRRLLKEMDNLYQDNITYEQMSGVASTDQLYLQFTMDQDFNPDLEGMRMSGHLHFDNGGIYNYPTLVEMEKYVDYRLDSLLFNTLDTDIFIFKNFINVPRTYLKNSALDIMLIGMQSFDLDYKYHVRFPLFRALKGNKEDKKNKGKEKEGKWVRAYDLEGEDKVGLDDTDDRHNSERLIRAREGNMKIRFHPTLFSFETNVEE